MIINMEFNKLHSFSIIGQCTVYTFFNIYNVVDNAIVFRFLSILVYHVNFKCYLGTFLIVKLNIF